MTCETTEVTPPEPKKKPDWWATENIRTTPERSKALDQLLEMLTYKRVGQSKVEKKFIHEYISCIKGIKRDGFGNYYIRVGSCPIMWSSHTDTVHEKKGFQVIGFDGKEVGVAAEDTSGSTCLGADDTAGVWHMLQMLDAGVPGLYIFHREEESGRKGSQWLLKNNKRILAGIEFAVALDRRSDDNFITHQMGDRCCSEVWANSFCDLLNADGLKYKTDRTGSYTDTATYTGVIGECTNISVGYSAAHSKWERLDLEHVFKLRDTLCSIGFINGLHSLVAIRKPGEKEVYTYNGGGGYHGGRYHGGTVYDSNDWEWVNGVRRRKVVAKPMTQEEREFMAEWDMMDGRENGYQCANGGTSQYVPPKTHADACLDILRGHNSGNTGTQSGTRVGTGVSNRSKIALLNPPQGANEANPDGSPVIIMPPAGDPIVGNAIPREDEDDESNYAGMIKLIKRNPEATLEFLSQMIDESPEIIADILDNEGLTEKTFSDEIMEMYGVVKL